MQKTQTTPRCSRCGSTFVRQTRPQGPMEYLLSLVHAYPFQCQVCWRRFTVRQPGVRQTAHELDRRQYERLETSMPVTFSGEMGDGQGVTTDVSLDGCNLRTSVELSVGTQLRLQLRAAHEDRPIVVESAVVRSVRSPAVGVQFVQFHLGERERLSRLVQKLLNAHRASA